MEITGLAEFGKALDDAVKALGALDGELGTVNFDPNDPGSIESAIQQVENIIDTRLGEYASNPIVGPIAEQMKERYRQAIIDRATEARMQGALKSDD
jgi:hypothetical protein